MLSRKLTLIFGVAVLFLSGFAGLQQVPNNGETQATTGLTGQFGH